MVKVLFLNHSKVRCGVQQFGSIVADTMKLSTVLKVTYLEVEGPEFLEEYKNFDVFVYNYHDQTMSWLNSDFTNHVNSCGIRQYCLTGHDQIADFDMTCNIIADPSGTDDDKTFYTGRIIPNVPVETPKNDVVTIGSFGFGFYQKNFHRFVELINREFDKAIIRLHIPANDFADVGGGMAGMFLHHAGSIVKPGLVFEASHDFLSREDMVRWLAKNDLNLFVYDDQPGRGISSAIDFALAARRPIGISKSSMFRHIYHDQRLLVDETSLSKIIENGVEPLREYYTKWSPESLCRRYEQILL